MIFIKIWNSYPESNPYICTVNNMFNLITAEFNLQMQQNSD